MRCGGVDREEDGAIEVRTGARRQALEAVAYHLVKWLIACLADFAAISLVSAAIAEQIGILRASSAFHGVQGSGGLARGRNSRDLA